MGRMQRLHRMIRHILKKLDKIAALQDNWNGYGAEPLSPQVIERTRRLIQGLVI